MKTRELVPIIGLITAVVFGGVQTFATLEARANTIEVARTIAEAAQATANSIGDCNR